MARKKQDPFPCRDHLDLLAFSIECIFLVFRDNDKILASGHRGGFQQAFDFPFSRTRIHHIPSNLYELYHVILPLKHKIALTISLIVGNLVRRVFSRFFPLSLLCGISTAPRIPLSIQ